MTEKEVGEGRRVKTKHKTPAWGAKTQSDGKPASTYLGRKMCLPKHEKFLHLPRRVIAGELCGRCDTSGLASKEGVTRTVKRRGTRCTRND